MNHTEGHRDGATYVAKFDYARLNKQAKWVFDVMKNGHWWTLGQISDLTTCPEASVSARIRDFRKPKFGALTVDRRRHSIYPGLYEYRLHLPSQLELL